jgi:hypothetical protein
MNDTAIEAKPAKAKADEWAERIAAQQRSGMSVKQFCKEQGKRPANRTSRRAPTPGIMSG